MSRWDTWLTNRPQKAVFYDEIHVWETENISWSIYYSIIRKPCVPR